jgi:uncharacterized repeat protein (TIGR02543 family)
MTTQITLDHQGGSSSGFNMTIAQFGVAMPTANLAIPTQTGLIFQGYYELPNGQGTRYYTATMTSANNWNKVDATFTIFAHWTSTQSNITFNKQQGTGGTDGVIAHHGQPMPAGSHVTAPTRSGYIFEGYWTTPSGAGIQYYLPNMASARAWVTTGSDVTLYARWTADEDFARSQLIDLISGIDPGNNTALREALDEANAVLNNPNSTTQEIWDAFNKLEPLIKQHQQQNPTPANLLWLALPLLFLGIVSLVVLLLAMRRRRA